MDVLHGLTSEFAHGRAFSEVVPVPSPPAGAGFTYTVGANYWERLAGIAFVLTSDANAANRDVVLTVNSGGGVALDKVPPAAVQVASKAYTYVYAPFAPAVNDTTALVNTQRCPTIFLQPAFTVVVSITNVQVTDAVTAIRFYVERFDTGPQGYPVGMVTESAVVSRAERLGD